MISGREFELVLHLYRYIVYVCVSKQIQSQFDGDEFGICMLNGERAHHPNGVNSIDRGILAHRSTNPNRFHVRTFCSASIEPICAHFRLLCFCFAREKKNKSKCEYYLNGNNIIIINRFKVFVQVFFCIGELFDCARGDFPNV